MSDDTAKPDPAVTYERLRNETAVLLGLDLTVDLPITQSLQLDCIALLRLEVDGLQGKVLAGEEVDLGRLAAALGMLQKLLPSAELKADPPEVRPYGEAKEKLRELIEATINAGPPQDQPTRAELEAEVTELRERLARGEAPSPAAPALPSADIVPLRPVPEPAKQQPSPSPVANNPSECEWREWYRAGGGGGGNFGIHNIPRYF